ncbi:MAG: hypothetical protein Q7R47_03055, partial [Candidatus Diapherotrites archaeon]|nr:hypothetical protein [Candidatus Diapherotrites archaeon]
MSQKLLFVGIALFVLVTAVWGQTIQTPNQVFAAMNLGKSTAVNQAEFVKLSFDPPRLMEGSTTIYELNGFIQTRSLKNEDYTLVIQVDGVHVGIDGWNGLALNNGDKLDTHLFLPSPNASSVTVQAEIMYGPSKTLIARVQKQLALPVAPPATPPQSQPASDFVGPPAPVFIQPDGTSAKNMTVPLPPGFIPQTITATACPEPANPAIPPHCETAVQKGVPPTSVFDTQSNTWENIFSDQSLDTFARWAEQQAGVSDEGLPVKIVLSNPPKEPVERVVIIKPIAPLVFATTFSSSSPQNLGVSLVSLASKDPKPLTNTDNGQSRSNGSTNLTEYEKIVVVREGDYPIGVQWSWSKLGSDWWKQGDYYPRVYLNRPTNPLSMFDGSPVQLADVEQKIVAAKKDWLPISPRVDSSSSSFDQSPPALVPVVLPDTSKTDSTGSVQDTGKQSGNGWKGNDIPVQWLGLENVLVVEIRSHSQNDRVVAQGSLKFRLPPQFSSSGVVYDKETKSVDKPPQFQLPDDPADRALWISFLTAGKKDSQLRLCPPSTSATSKPCTTQSVALDAVKDNSGQTTAVEIPSSTLFSILDALGALNGTAGSDLVELVATNENGTPLIIGSMEVTTSCKTLLECLARVDKELVDSLMGAVPVGPKDVTPLESTPPATPVQPELVTKFEVYSTSWCDQCKPLIEYLNSKGFFESTDFMKYDVDKDAAK